MTVVLSPGPSKVNYQPVSIPPPANSKEPPRELVAYSIQPVQSVQNLEFFAGPKDFDILASIRTDLTQAINFGMFAVIVVPLLRSLKWVHGYIGNYGWSIVILTIIINAIMFPLRHKRAVFRVDSRPLVARSVLCAAGADGRDELLAAEDDAGDRRRSRAAEDDDVHAALHDVHLPVAALRRAHLLRRHESLDDRSAVPHQLPDRTAEREDGAAG